MSRVSRSRFLLTLMLGLLAAGGIATAGGPYVFYSVTPCRLADTRDPNGPTGGPNLTNGVTRSFPVYGNDARPCGIPPAAKAVAINGAVVLPQGDGYLTFFPHGTAVPATSTINFYASTQVLANGQLVPLGSNPAVQLSVWPSITGTGTAHLVLDITGYFTEP